jgi:hypothetical protein
MVHRALIAAAVLATVGCLDESIPRPAAFPCPDGKCPLGLSCSPDAVCRVAVPDGGDTVAVDAGPDEDAGAPDAGPDAGPDGGLDDAGALDAGPSEITAIVTEASASTLAGSNVVRQGAGPITLDITGQSLGGATNVTVGGNTANLVGDSDTQLRITTTIDHGVDAGALPVAVTIVGGTTITAASLFSVSDITVGPTGVDPPGGDGSSLHPFRSLTQALLVAGSSASGLGDTVLLANGTYDLANGESWPTASALANTAKPGIANAANLPSGVTVVGESEAQTVLSGAGAAILSVAEPVAIVPAGSGSLVQNLTISGFGFGYLTNSGSNALHEVLIESSSQQGILVWGPLTGPPASLSVTGDSQVTGGQLDGIFCRHGNLTLDGGSLNGNGGVGLSLQDEAVASLSGVDIFGNSEGILAESNGPTHSQSFTVDTCHIHDNQTAGIEAHSNSGSSHQIYVTNSEIDSNDTGIYLSIAVQNSLTSTTVAVDGGIIHDNSRDGIEVDAAPWHISALDLAGVTVQDNGESGLELAPDLTATGALDGGGSFKLRNVISTGNDYGLRIEGRPIVADLGPAADGGLNLLTQNIAYQLSDERGQNAALAIDATGVVLGDAGSWPAGTLQIGPVSQPPAFQIVNPGNAIQF